MYLGLFVLLGFLGYLVWYVISFVIQLIIGICVLPSKSRSGGLGLESEIRRAKTMVGHVAYMLVGGINPIFMIIDYDDRGRVVDAKGHRFCSYDLSPIESRGYYFKSDRKAMAKFSILWSELEAQGLKTTKERVKWSKAWLANHPD